MDDKSFDSLLAAVEKIEKASSNIETAWGKIEGSLSGAAKAASKTGTALGGAAVGGTKKRRFNLSGSSAGEMPSQGDMQVAAAPDRGEKPSGASSAAASAAKGRASSGKSDHEKFADSVQKATEQKSKREQGPAQGHFGRIISGATEGWASGQATASEFGRTRLGGGLNGIAKGARMALGGGDAETVRQAYTNPENATFTTQMFGPSDITNLLKDSSNALGSFLPSVTNTMGQTSRYYSATLYGGNQMSRSDVAKRTLGLLGGLSGVTSAGSDAAVAEYLSSAGVPIGSSTYESMLNTVGNAARYLNISNESAARSVQGLTSASGSGNLLKQLGIYTADIDTGKEKTQGQIFKEIADRLTAGRGKATVEQTQQSIRRGSLGVTIEGLFGNDATTAGMFKQYMIERAKGKELDLSSSSRIDALLGSSGNKNPLQPSMDLATKQSQAMNTASDEYVSGIQAATAGLMALTDASGALSKAMGAGSAMVQTLFGNESAKGLISGLSSILDFTTKGLGTIQTDINGLNMVNAPAVGVSMAATGALIAGGLASVAVGGAASGALGSLPSALNLGAAGTGGDTPSTADLLTNYNSSFSGTSTDMSSTATSTATSSSASTGKLFDFGWLGSYRVTTNVGDTDAEHPRGHSGTDYGMSNGTDVRAVADGVVIAAKGGLPNNTGSGLGNYVQILHTATDGSEYNSVYGHLSATLVNVNDRVSRGQVIGKSGNTGFSTGPHLHFEVNKGKTRRGGVYDSSIQMKLSDAANITGSGSTISGESGSAVSSALGTASKYSQIPKAALSAYNILQKLYSGNTAQISSAITALGGTVSIPQSVISQYLNSAGTTASGVTAAQNIPYTGAGAAASSGNTVNITVSVPDVTSSEAMKFAQLVQGYLSSNSLASNMGSS